MKDMKKLCALKNARALTSHQRETRRDWARRGEGMKPISWSRSRAQCGGFHIMFLSCKFTHNDIDLAFYEPRPSSGSPDPGLSIPSWARTAAELSGGRLIPESESANSNSCLRWLFSPWRMLTCLLRLTMSASRGSWMTKKSIFFCCMLCPYFLINSGTFCILRAE